MIWLQAFLTYSILVLTAARNPGRRAAENHHLRSHSTNSTLDEGSGSSVLQQTIDISRAIAFTGQPVGQELSSDSGPIEATIETFLLRLQDAMVKVIVGIILLAFSVPILWYNEKSRAVYETLMRKAERDVRVLPKGSAPEENNNNWPVLLSGEEMRAVTPVKHPQFNLKYDAGVICIRSSVSVYQWVEKQRIEQKEKPGGGKEKVTMYDYEKQWTTIFNDGSTFKKPGYENTKPQGLAIGTETVWAPRVEFGNGFVLSDDLKYQVTGGAAPKNLHNVVLEATRQKFSRAGDTFYTGNSSSPQIGDASVTFTVVFDDIATVLALQVAREGGASFLPYRVIRRPGCPCCPLSEEQEKEALLEEGLKSPTDVTEEDVWGGILWCCCWSCNIISMCVAVATMPELNHLLKGTLGMKECFKAVRDRYGVMKWLGRIVGWLLMFAGLNMCFSPFPAYIRIIPFLGPLLSNLSASLIFFFSIIVTVIVSLLIVIAAYSLYHPSAALFYFGILGILITGIVTASVISAH